MLPAGLQRCLLSSSVTRTRRLLLRSPARSARRTRTCCPSSSRRRWSGFGRVRTSCPASSWSRWGALRGMSREDAEGREGEGLQGPRPELAGRLRMRRVGSRGRRCMQADAAPCCLQAPPCSTQRTPHPAPLRRCWCRSWGRTGRPRWLPLTSSPWPQPPSDRCETPWSCRARAWHLGTQHHPLPHTRPPCRHTGALLRAARRAARGDEGAGAAAGQRGSSGAGFPRAALLMLATPCPQRRQADERAWPACSSTAALLCRPAPLCEI